MACTFNGNSDVFGIGIRIGYYSQVIAIWFSNYFYPPEVSGLRAVNNLFLLALMIAGFTYFANTATTHVIEAFLLLQIGIVVGLVGITEAARFSTKYRSVSVERLLIRSVLFTAGALFNVLFWWKGVDVMMATPCHGVTMKGVGTYAWYGWRVSLYGWMRTVMKIQSLFAALWTAPCHASHDMALLVCDHGAKDARSQFVRAIKAEGQEHPHDFGIQLTDQEQCLQASIPMNRLCSQTCCCRKDLGLVTAMALGKKNRAFAVPDMLEVLAEAEQYLHAILSVYSIEEVATPPTSICKCLPRSTKTRRLIRCKDSTSYFRCLWQCFCMTFDLSSLKIRWILALHITKAGEHSILHWPRFLNKVYELKKTPRAPNWRHLMIASDLHLSKLPSTKTTAVWTWEAILQFIFIGLLIVQVELTIVWNHVSGLDSLAPLGQLIPFVLGVGGLGKVLWGKVCLMRKGIKHTFDAEKESEYESALSVYNDRRKPLDQLGRQARIKMAATA